MRASGRKLPILFSPAEHENNRGTHLCGAQESGCDLLLNTRITGATFCGTEQQSNFRTGSTGGPNGTKRRSSFSPK
jgi:hypothetical protein